jgi:hypothetical protein
MKQHAFAPHRAFWRWALTGTLALGLAACGGGDDDEGSKAPSGTSSILSATLSGDQEPTPTVTGALGSGTLTLELPSRALTGGIIINGMTATMAHVHLGEVGVNGGVIVNLSEISPGSGSWAVPANTVLTEAQATAFSAGGLYFNAHTPENPGGEIRGQIGREVYAAQLTASQEVPTNSSSATGVGLISLDPVSKKFTARMTLTGISATVAHIHTGNLGANGGVIFPLTQTAAGSNIWVAAADATMTDAQIATMKAGGLYFNAHSAAFPGGEIRGQIARNVRYASLNAAQEVPSNASTATGVGNLVIDPITRAASGGITLTGMTATMAHIHLGAPGANGGVIIGLTNAGGGVWSVPANASLTADQFKAFKQGNLYFNAHSAAFPGGEIRGQIR